MKCEYESVTKLKENNLTRKTVYSNYSFCSKPGDTTNFSEYPDEDNLSPEFIRSYIAEARNIEPVIPKELHNFIIEKSCIRIIYKILN